MRGLRFRKLHVASCRLQVQVASCGLQIPGLSHLPPAHLPPDCYLLLGYQREIDLIVLRLPGRRDGARWRTRGRCRRGEGSAGGSCCGRRRRTGRRCADDRRRRSRGGCRDGRRGVGIRQAVRPWTRRNGIAVTHSAVLQGACEALQRDDLHVVARLGAGQDGVGAVVAGLAIQPAMAGGLAEQLARVLGKLGSVAVAAARLVDPGPAVGIGDRIHVAVTIRAPHPLGRHRVAQAARLRAWVTLIAVVRAIVGWLQRRIHRSRCVVHRPGHQAGRSFLVYLPIRRKLLCLQARACGAWPVTCLAHPAPLAGPAPPRRGIEHTAPAGC